jgi:hypothetical protein
MPAVRAFKSSLLYHSYITSIDSYGSAVNQPIRDFLMCRGQNAPERGSRDLHPGRRFFLIKPVEIGKTKRLEFIESQHDFLQ